MTFEDVLRPLTTEQFEQDYVGRRYVVLKGRPRRFATLLPWSRLTRILRHLRITGSRCRLVHQGQRLDRATYLWRPDDENGSYIKDREVARLLSAGATLVLSQVDELSDEIRELAESAERVFGSYVGINMYAGWRAERGFDLHWDEHDTLIVQVHGRKEWQVYSPTRESPIPDDPTGEADKPAGNPVWQGILEDGDVLYMPRGWWHVACPLNEPTLHLTVGLRHPKGVDLLRWLATELQAHVAVRRDLPRRKGVDAERQYVEQLRQHLFQCLTPDVVSRYLQTLERETPRRPLITLPQDVTTRPALEETSRLRLSQGQALHFEESGDPGILNVKVGDGTFGVARPVVDALRRLSHTAPCTLLELKRVDPSSAGLLHACVVGLLTSGVLWIEAEAEVPADALTETSSVASSAGK